MIASPLRIRPASRLAGLAAILVQEGSRAHSLLNRAAEELLESCVAGAAAFRPLADADPATLAAASGGAELAALWAAEVPEWPPHLVLDPAWLNAFWQLRRLRLLSPDAETRAEMAYGAAQVKLACLNALAAMHSLRRVTPEVGEAIAMLARAVLVMLGGACPGPRAFACRLAEVGRELGPLIPQPALEALIATLRSPEISDDQARQAVRQVIATAGDKALGWLAQGVAAVLEGPPPAAGLDAL